MDELIGKRLPSDDASNVGDRARDALRRQQAGREERARELERQAEEVRGRLGEVTRALEMAQEEVSRQAMETQAMAKRVRQLSSENE